VALTANPAQFTASGGNGTLAVAAARECSWAAAAQADWIRLTAPVEGQGDGSVAYTVLPNPQAVARRAAVVVGGQSAELTQEASPCTFTVSRRAFELDAREQTAAVDVQAPAGCAWTAASDSSWLTIIEGEQSTGSGRVRFRAAANSGPQARSGSLTVAGLRIDVRQTSGNTPPPPPPPGECTYQVSPDTAQANASQTDGSFAVVSQTGCSWTAVSDESWLTITAGSSGSGAGQVVYRAAANSATASRTAHIDVNGAVFTLVQVGANLICNYSINPTSESFSADGGTGDIDVDSGLLCPWTASTTASWIEITSGLLGTGSGSVQYQVDANSDTSPRTGTIRIAGFDFTVQQAAGGEEVTINGNVEALAGSCPNRTFQIDGQDVRTDASTSFQRGGCGKLENGIGVRVTGRIGSDDVLTASEVRF
jgi:hypothetical protein